ncbi:MAG TPA: 50S ribosomal protein L30 [Firmicutes bacterium]|nr:50S ribosomal protein L30 [Bacillota bacterium]
MADKMIKITLVRSTSGRLAKQQKTVEALGLRKIGQSVVKKDNECTRGMIFVVKHLVEVSEA